MAGVIATIPKYQFSSALGIPLVNGTLETYLAGTTTPVATYQDRALTIANPTTISLDSRGECVLWLDSTKTYKFVLKNALGVTQWTEDNISGAGADADTLRTDLAASGGAALVGFIQSGAGAVARTEQAKLRDLVCIKDFGTGDNSAALQLAVDSLVNTGGTVLIPLDRTYSWTSQVTVSSLFPINIIGTGAGNVFDASENPPGLVIGANIAGSMIKYVAPSARVSHGGGRVSGLIFYDATSTGGDPGTYTCTAALELYDFSLSSVEDCAFHGINGSAIYGEFLVMSTIRGNRIRYCGAAGKPAMYFPATDATYTCQSTDIAFNKVEVCHEGAYLSFGANSADCKVFGNGFEADTTNASSNNGFMSVAGVSHTIVGNHLNRTTGTQITLSGQTCTVTGNAFRGGAYNTTALVVTGDRNSITGNTFGSTRTKYEVDITGPHNVFSANTLYFSGAIRIGAAGNSVTGNNINLCSATTAELGAGADYWIAENSDGSSVGAIISGNVLSNSGGSVTTTGGIREFGTGTNVSNNTFRSFAGSGNGANCIRIDSELAVLTGNSETGSTTLYSYANTTALGSVEVASSYAINGGAVPFLGAVVYDPGSLADGAGVTTSVNVDGARAGDLVLVSFTQDLQGIQLTGWVSAVDSVSVRFQNETGGVLDLASGTLKARVFKR